MEREIEKERRSRKVKTKRDNFTKRTELGREKERSNKEIMKKNQGKKNVTWN